MSDDQDIFRFRPLLNEIIPASPRILGNSLNGWVSFAVTKTTIIDCEQIGVQTRRQTRVNRDSKWEGAGPCVPMQEKDGRSFLCGGLNFRLSRHVGRGVWKFLVDPVREDKPSTYGGVVRAAKLEIDRLSSCRVTS
jgi:hypothetical protein